MTTKTITMKTDEEGAHGEPLEAGETYRMAAASADHWLKRRKADLVSDDTDDPAAPRVAPTRAEKVAKIEPEPDPDAAAKTKAEAKAAAAEAKAAAKNRAGADAKRAANTAAAADKSTSAIEKPADGGATAGEPTKV